MVGLLSVLGVLVAIFVFPNQFKSKQTDQGQAADSERSVPDEILVKFKDGLGTAEQARILSAQNLTLKEELPDIDVLVLKVNSHARDAVIAALNRNPNVEFAEVNGIVQAQFTPNDYYFNTGTYQDTLRAIHAPEAWDITQGSPTVKIAILDTGINTNHEDLAGKVVLTYGTAGANDVAGHGTHVAGDAAAVTNNTVGVAGIGFNSSLFNVKVMSDFGTGTIDSIAKGISWAANNGANVINMSFGTGSASRTLERAVNQAWNKGAVLVAAAGNQGCECPFFPAAYTNVIAVTGKDYGNYRYGNYGDWVDVMAPVTTFSTMVDGSYSSMSGTSMSTPQVSGLAGLLFAQVKGTTTSGGKKGNTSLNAKVRSCIENGAVDLGITGTGHGLINAYNSVVLCSQ